MDTLASVLALTVSIDASITNQTDYVAVLYEGMMYIAPMQETRRCIKGVGVEGFPCAKKHIRAGKVKVNEARQLLARARAKGAVVGSNARPV